MKRITIIMIFIFVTVISVTAQKFEDESEYYPKTIPIDRIFIHSLGYRIDYLKHDYTIGTLWVPIEWFRPTTKKGEIVHGKSAQYPYVTFFFKNGEFDHFRLYLFENITHSSWGILDILADYSDKFPSPDSEIEIEF